MVEEEEVVTISRKEEEKHFVVTLLKIHGVNVYTLLDSEATPNIVSTRPVNLLALKAEKMEKVVIVSNGKIQFFG